jgi:hypothetical protein
MTLAERLDPEISELMVDLPTEMQAVAETLRRLILNSSPLIQEQKRWNQPVYFYQKRLICYLAFHKSHLNFGFDYGALLTDPEGLLDGTGKNMRHVKLGTTADIRQEQFAAWLEESMRIIDESRGRL